jgi:hypothetical protein
VVNAYRYAARVQRKPYRQRWVFRLNPSGWVSFISFILVNSRRLEKSKRIDLSLAFIFELVDDSTILEFSLTCFCVSEARIEGLGIVGTVFGKLQKKKKKNHLELKLFGVYHHDFEQFFLRWRCFGFFSYFGIMLSSSGYL